MNSTSFRQVRLRGAHLFIVVAGERERLVRPHPQEREGGGCAREDGALWPRPLGYQTRRKTYLPMKPWSRSLSSGERAGVRASVLHLTSLTTMKRCAQNDGRPAPKRAALIRRPKARRLAFVRQSQRASAADSALGIVAAPRLRQVQEVLHDAPRGFGRARHLDVELRGVAIASVFVFTTVGNPAGQRLAGSGPANAEVVNIAAPMARWS